MNRLRLLFISTIFPSQAANRHAAYSLQQIEALGEYYDIDVINPIPWHRKILAKIPAHEILDSINIYHPAYYYTPRIFRSYYGLFYYLSVMKLANKLFSIDKYSFIYSSWLYPDGWAAAKLSSKYHIPLYAKAIGTDANRLIEGSPLASKSLDVVDHATKVFCVSEALKSKLISIGANPEKLLVTYSGVNRAVFRPLDKMTMRAEWGIPADASVVLYVGNLIPTKGLNELAEAFEKLLDDKSKKYILIFAGTGSFGEILVKRFRRAGIIDKVMFKGSCSLPAVSGLMNAADVVCLPSYNEGMPNVVLEALCCNAKIVATDVGGIPELLSRHKNLYLLPPQDSANLASVLRLAIDSDCIEDKAEDIYSWRENAFRLSRIFSGEIQ